MFAKVRGSRGEVGDRAQAQPRPGGQRSAGTDGGNSSARANAPGRRAANAAMLWYLGDNGELEMTRARTGISDGQRTQVESDELREGMQIIVGVTQGAQADSSNPFQAPMQAGPRPPGAF
jgi:hypothetical protein